MAAKAEFGLLSDDPKIINRCKAICEEFHYGFIAWKNLDKFLEESGDGPPECKLIVACSAGAHNKEKAAEYAQVTRQFCVDAFIICTVSGKFGKEGAAFLKKSGANLIIQEEELLEASKLEYACTQVIRAEYLTIKTSDLSPGKVITFDIFHLLPQRKKFLKFAFDGDIFTKDKIAKLGEVGELYISKSSSEKFKQYTFDNPDLSAGGLARRCRAQYLALYSSFSQLVFLLTDQSEHASFTEGEKLLKNCRTLAGELVVALGALGNAWEIVNNTAIGEFGSTERAPAIAAYAAVFALLLNIENIEEIMIATLLADLGLLLLPPSISGKIRNDQTDKFTDDEKFIYQKYPFKSLDLILSRKLPVVEKLRELLLATHERHDGTGFPRQLLGRKVTEEVQLIQFCRSFDRNTVVKLGKPRVDREQLLKEMIMAELDKPGKYSPLFISKLKSTFC